MKNILLLYLIITSTLIFAQENSIPNINNLENENCFFAENNEYALLLGNEFRNVVVQTERVGSNMYVLSFEGPTDERIPKLSKYNSTGDLVWETAWQDSTSIDKFFYDEGRILLTGFTRPFASGNSSILIALEDKGNTFNTVLSKKIDLSPRREASRGIIRLNDNNTPYGMLMHNGVNSIDDTHIALLDASLDIVEIKGYDLGDDQIWNGPANDLNNTISIYGNEANDTDEGFIINAQYDLNVINAFSFFGLEYIRDIAPNEANRQRLIVSNKAITLVDENFQILHSLSTPNVTVNLLVKGPFVSASPISFDYFILSRQEVAGEEKLLITKISTTSSNLLNIEWSRIVDFEGDALNGQFNVNVNGNTASFLFSETVENISNGFGDADIIISEFNERSCKLVDFPIVANEHNVEVLDQKMNIFDEPIPPSLDLFQIASNEMFCNSLESCNPCETDSTPPDVFCFPTSQPFSLNSNGEFQANAGNLNITLSDECRVGVSLSQSLFTCENLGSNIITVTATDEAGNSSSCTYDVRIADPNNHCACFDDQSAPVISCSEGIVIYELGENGSVPINLELHGVQAFDDCGVDEIELQTEMLDCDDLTTIPSAITVLATDLNGNMAECTINYILIDPNQFCIPETCDEACFSGSIDLSTGIDNQGQVLPVGLYVGNWTLIDGPDPINYPRPGFVLNPNNAWDQLPGSQYISPYPNPNNNDSHPEPYLFERCFCVCQVSALVELNISSHVDNFINIGLYDDSGNEIAELIDFQGPSSTAAFNNPAFFSSTQHQLTQGTYCLRAGLRNDGKVTMGMQINAAVSNAGLIESSCCTPYSFMVGTVFQDMECDTINNLNMDNGLEGVNVSLSQGGAVLETAVTDQFGYFVFNDYPSGNYIISVEPIQSSQLTQGFNGYNVSLKDDEVIGDLDFGFCLDEERCCASSELLTNQANLQLNSESIQYSDKEGLSIIAPELFDCQYISKVYWGDGQVINLLPGEPLPNHIYNGNGSYLISFEVSATFSDGELCQMDEVNLTVVINDCTVSVDFPDSNIGSIKIYPIPFSEMVNIDFSRNNAGYSLDIINVSGQIVRSMEIPSGITTFNTSTVKMTPGLYIFRFISKDGNSTLESKSIKI